jgi:hypothetical protein
VKFASETGPFAIDYDALCYRDEEDAFLDKLCTLRVCARAPGDILSRLGPLSKFERVVAENGRGVNISEFASWVQGPVESGPGQQLQVNCAWCRDDVRPIFEDARGVLLGGDMLWRGRR